MSGAQRSARVNEENMRSLCGMFEQMDPSVIYQVLEHTNGDLETAVEALLNMGPKAPTTAPITQTPPTNSPTSICLTPAPTVAPVRPTGRQTELVNANVATPINSNTNANTSGSGSGNEAVATTTPAVAGLFPNFFSPVLTVPNLMPPISPTTTATPTATSVDAPSAPNSDPSGECNGDTTQQTTGESTSDLDQPQTQLVEALRTEIVSLQSRNEELQSVLEAQSQKILSLEGLHLGLEQQVSSLQQSLRQQTEQYNRDITLASNISKQAFLHSLSSLAHTLQLSVSSLTKDCNDPRITASDMFQKVSSQMNLKSGLVASSTPATPNLANLYQTGSNKTATPQTVQLNQVLLSPQPTTLGLQTPQATLPTRQPPPYAILYNQPQTPLTQPQVVPQTPTQPTISGLLDAERERNVAWEAEKFRKLNIQGL
ncbi:hypothetical protein Pelo_14205 [Pelomyxa schiedti]|nr:hypothetical protein Pelo_14205 [Pelomyxa schiedti]